MLSYRPGLHNYKFDCAIVKLAFDSMRDEHESFERLGAFAVVGTEAGLLCSHCSVNALRAG
jgi:hypothetical protein